MAILNLPTKQRFEPRNMFLILVARAVCYKKHGMARIITGVDSNGVRHNEPNYSRDMDELHDGREVTLPDDAKPGKTKLWNMKSWVTTACCDWLGAQLLLWFTESPASYCQCRRCTWNRSHCNAYRPHSFWRTPVEGAYQQVLQKRVYADLQVVIERIRANPPKTKTARANLFKIHGLNTLYQSWDPEYIRYALPLQIPTDLMHLFADGLLRSECAWLFFVLFKLGLDEKKANKRIRSYSWPKDCRIPNLHPNLREGTTGGVPISSRTMRMTASQMHVFAIHSVELLIGGPDPVLTSDMRSHPAWRCWCKLAELYTVIVAQELPLADIQRIDDLQFEHAVLFDQVPDWAGLQRPKHHALVHIAEDTWNFGPLRGLWCFAFENVNQIIKLGAHASNFRNEAETVLAYWGMRWTRALVTGQSL